VSDNLPDNVTFVSVVPTQGNANNSATVVTWDIGALATNAGAQLTLTVTPNSTGPCVNSAIVNAVTQDPNPDDDAATATVTVIPSSVPPQLTNTVVNANGTFRFTVISAPGQTTIIEDSTNLISWLKIYTNTVGGTYTFTNLNTSLYPDLFYRVIPGP
jgi:hypothetical protein